MSQEKLKNILEKYTNDIESNKIDKFSEIEKKEILFAIGWTDLLAKKDVINRDTKTIKYLCQTKLQSLFLLEKQFQNPVENINNTEYKTDYAIHKYNYTNNLAFGEQSWNISVSKHVLNHVISDVSRYKSWSLEEKMKHSRWLKPSFSVKNWEQQNIMNKKYISLDPEKVNLPIIDFLKTGGLEKKKYTPAEKLVLKQRFLANHNSCKEILFWYEALVLPKDDWYSQETTERIVKLKNKDKPIWYLVSENRPLRYTENHLRKYRWNDVSFEVFLTKETLLAYLKNELFFISKQRERFYEAITYLKTFDSKLEGKEKMEYAYLWFSTHGTFTDQVITEKLEQIISSKDKRGEAQTIESIIVQALKWIKESEIKEKIIREHYNAVIYNNLF